MYCKTPSVVELILGYHEIPDSWDLLTYQALSETSTDHPRLTNSLDVANVRKLLNSPITKKFADAWFCTSRAAKLCAACFLATM